MVGLLTDLQDTSVLPMRIALFGPPGVGKGTQTRLLSTRRGLTQISTGIILRNAIRNETPVGTEAREYMNEGRLVPGRLIRTLAEEAIADTGFNNFILDGYPRTIEQAQWLTEFLDGHGCPMSAVISLKVPQSVIVERLSKRRVNKATGENYHLDFKPPPPTVDASLIIQRRDDRPEAILKRLDVYAEETEPVEAFYRERGALFEINGVGEIEEVNQRIEQVLLQVVPA